jgi:hypothetical protein
VPNLFWKVKQVWYGGSSIKAGRDAYRSGTHFDDYPVTGHQADERDAIAILY